MTQVLAERPIAELFQFAGTICCGEAVGVGDRFGNGFEVQRLSARDGFGVDHFAEFYGDVG